MFEVVFLLIGLIAGAFAAWLFAKGRLQSVFSEKLREAESRASASGALAEELRRQATERQSEISGLRAELGSERQTRAVAETKYQEAERSLAEQRQLLDAMKKEMSDTFSALSSAALKSSSEDFLKLAGEHLGKVVADTKGKLGEHQAAMDGLVRPLQEALKTYREQIHQIEVKRGTDYTSLDAQIKQLSVTHMELQRETGNLVSALRKPHIRGRWGEVTLRNVVELAGMSSHCDFTEQVTFNEESGRLRPDMVVHLPGARDIVVDSKVSMEALLDMASAKTDEEKKTALKRHAQHVKEQINRLSSKEYWRQFSKSPEIAVLFIAESALVAALESEPTLMEEGLSKKILVTTPTTLFALLTTVAYGWRQERIAKNAEQIAALGRELYERTSVWAEHINNIGKALGSAVRTYDEAVGSMDKRIMPSIRKFKELGATGAGEIQELKQIDKTPRNLDVAE